MRWSLFLAHLLQLNLCLGQLLFNIHSTWDSIRLEKRVYHNDEFPCIPESASGKDAVVMKFDLNLCNMGNNLFYMDPETTFQFHLYGENVSGTFLLGTTTTPIPYLRDTTCMNRHVHYYSGDSFSLSAGCCCWFSKSNACQLIYLGLLGQVDLENYSNIVLDLTLDSLHEELDLKTGTETPESLLKIHGLGHNFDVSPFLMLVLAIFAIVLLQYCRHPLRFHSKTNVI